MHNWLLHCWKNLYSINFCELWSNNKLQITLLLTHCYETYCCCPHFRCSELKESAFNLLFFSFKKEDVYLFKRFSTHFFRHAEIKNTKYISSSHWMLHIICTKRKKITFNINPDMRKECNLNRKLYKILLKCANQCD